MTTPPAASERRAGFLGEIRKRNIHKHLAIYLSAAITAIGIVNLLSVRYQLPQWLFDGFFIFVIFGFLHVLVFGWFRGDAGRRGIKLMLHGAVLAAASGFAVYVVTSPRTSLLPRNAKTVAVLPFRNMSEGTENEFFADGITEDILTQLSKIEDLRVISRTSVMQYKNSEKSLRTIGAELGAGTILEGSVRYAGDRVRIDGRLINAQSDEHLWAETYDRDISNIFAIQSDVAQQIALALKATLSPDERRLIERTPTTDSDAYAYYLRGRELYHNFTGESNEQAIGLFRRAIEIDSSFALAYAGLADAYGQRVQRFGYDRVWADSAMALSYKAIAIDPDLAEPYKSLGLAFSQKEKYRKSLELYSNAVKKNPNLASAVGNMGLIYLWIGDPERALPLVQKSLLLSPGRGTGYFHLGTVYEALELDSLTEAHFLRALELQPDLLFIYREVSRVYAAQGRFDEAYRLLDSLVARNGEEWALLVGLADLEVIRGKDPRRAEDLYRRALDLLTLEAGPTTEIAWLLRQRNKPDEANQMIQASIGVNTRQIEAGSENYEFPYDMARVYCFLGDTIQANRWLSQAIDAGWIFPRSTEIDPYLEPVRETGAFRRMMSDLRDRLSTARSSLEAKGLIPAGGLPGNSF